MCMFLLIIHAGILIICMGYSLRKSILFIAISLDGYIADKNGHVDWLNGQSDEVENEDTYI